jgi:hypothetical protein
MRWWAAFAAEVKQQRIKHRDWDRLGSLVPIIDQRLKFGAFQTTTPHTGD